MNEIPAQRGTTPTDSFTDNIVLSGSTAVRSALRATGKDQQEDQKKGYLSTLMSSFDIPSLHDGRNEDAVLVPSDEDISVADETNGHYVSFFRSFFQSKKYLIVTWLVIRCSFFFIPARRDSLYDLFPLTLFLFFNSLSIPFHRPTLLLLFYLL